MEHCKRSLVLLDWIVLDLLLCYSFLLFALLSIFILFHRLNHKLSGNYLFSYIKFHPLLHYDLGGSWLVHSDTQCQVWEAEASLPRQKWGRGRLRNAFESISNFLAFLHFLSLSIVNLHFIFLITLMNFLGCKWVGERVKNWHKGHRFRSQ